MEVKTFKEIMTEIMSDRSTDQRTHTQVYLEVSCPIIKDEQKVRCIAHIEMHLRANLSISHDII